MFDISVTWRILRFGQVGSSFFRVASIISALILDIFQGFSSSRLHGKNQQVRQIKFDNLVYGGIFHVGHIGMSFFRVDVDILLQDRYMRLETQCRR